MRIAEYFAGIGGVGVGASLAGVEPVYACEYDPKDQAISYFYRNVHHLNFPNQVFDFKPIRAIENAYPADIAHFSPVCRNFSTHWDRKESDSDILNAQKASQLMLSYDWVTIEQVKEYHDSVSYHIIRKALIDNGYRVTCRIINMMNYGIPQSRKRLWMIATRKAINPIIPFSRQPLISWDSATEHLHASLPIKKSVTGVYVRKLENCKKRYPGATSFLVARSGLAIAPNGHPCFTIRRTFARFDCIEYNNTLLMYKNGKWYDAKNLEFFKVLSGFPSSWKTFNSTLNFAGFGDCVPPKFYQQLLAANGLAQI